MLSLLLTLFISLFSVGSTIYPIEDYQENNIIIYDSKPINYSATWDDHSGYITSFFELADDEVWFNMEDKFSDVFSEFTSIYSSFNQYYDVNNVQGLYILIPPFYIQQNVYDSYSNWVTTNYSNYRVTSLTLANKVSSTEIDYFYYIHRVWFHLANGSHLLFDWYTDGNNRTGTYTLKNTLYSSSYSVIWENQFNYTLFAMDNFTFSNVFKNSDTWDTDEYASNQYADGYRAGYDTGVGAGETAGYNTGYGEGYQAGLVDGASTLEYDTTALTIFNGIFDVGLLPVNVFLTIFNFELFGVNIAGILSGLLTLSVVIIIVRFLLGGKKDD